MQDNLKTREFLETKKNTLSEMKSLLDGINRLDTAEEKISSLKTQ